MTKLAPIGFESFEIMISESHLQALVDVETSRRCLHNGKEQMLKISMWQLQENCGSRLKGKCWQLELLAWKNRQGQSSVSTSMDLMHVTSHPPTRDLPEAAIGQS
ncbi:hypothetical protein AVEN_21323-1 [Araneus ventricosus]|uniref:Uncharacterized protein n=1 Tax=Araneus ventricosus TaxID=182803 RepID=A0A4Y2SV66_ARAVE|nr:hypothetical protein AVEN_21323-1 [Araneus ventricosus]